MTPSLPLVSTSRLCSLCLRPCSFSADSPAFYFITNADTRALIPSPRGHPGRPRPHATLFPVSRTPRLLTALGSAAASPSQTWRRSWVMLAGSPALCRGLWPCSVGQLWLQKTRPHCLPTSKSVPYGARDSADGGQVSCFLGLREHLAAGGQNQDGPLPLRHVPISRPSAGQRGSSPARRLGLFHAGGLGSEASTTRQAPHKGSASFGLERASAPHQHASVCAAWMIAGQRAGEGDRPGHGCIDRAADTQTHQQRPAETLGQQCTCHRCSERSSLPVPHGEGPHGGHQATRTDELAERAHRDPTCYRHHRRQGA